MTDKYTIALQEIWTLNYVTGIENFWIQYIMSNMVSLQLCKTIYIIVIEDEII